MINVLFITPVYPSAALPHAGIFVRRLAEALQLRGVAVTVVHPVPFVPAPLAALSKRLRLFSQQSDVADASVVPLYKPSYWSYPYSSLYGAQHLFVYHAIRSLHALRLESFDVIHAHFGYFPGYVGMMLRSKCHARLVVTLHGSDVNVYPFVNRIALARFKRVMKNADVVTCVSGALSEKTESLTGVRPIVLHNGINYETCANRAEKSALRVRLKIPAHGFCVLFVGSLIKTKGVLELCSALTRLAAQGVRAIFIGDGPLRGIVEGTSNAQCLGLLPSFDSVLDYMLAADVLVLPSYREGTPTVIVEAGAAGTPVIASNVGGIPELLNNDRGILLKEVSAEAVIDAILFAKLNYSWCTECAARLRAFVKEKHDLRKTAEAYERIYSSEK